MNDLYIKLGSYSGNNNFLLSLKSQYVKYGRLSERQLYFAEKALTPRPKATEFSRKKGDKINITKWLSRTLAKNNNMEYFFRNLIIEDITDETNKSIQVSISFNSSVTTSCHLCGKGLDTEISKATGIGPVCAKKYLKIKRVSLDNAHEILAKIEEEAKIAGVIGPVWIPKSQIRTPLHQMLYEDKYGNEK